MGNLSTFQDIVYVGVEGGVCAGKTTTVETINNNHLVNALPEYTQMLPSDHKVWKEVLSPNERLQLFLSLEEQRIQTIQKAPYLSVIGDRCIFSIIAFEFALMRLGYSTEIEKYLDHPILIPDITIFFDIDNDLRETRWFNRGESMSSIFINRKFNNAIKYFFQLLSEITDIEVWIMDANELNMINKTLLAIDIAHNKKSQQVFPIRFITSQLFDYALH